MRVIKWAFGLTCSLALGLNAEACDFEDSDGPDIAIVLSGGGAFASTQVGALQIIDEEEIPVHCVVGTSFGSVVGGLYASGYSAAEIGEIFESTKWNEVVVANLPRENKSYLQKEAEEDFLTGYLAGIEDGAVKLPSGLTSMQGLRTYFRELMFHVVPGRSFDDLSMPFRPVATNLSTGEATAFEEGDIVESILASMAVPALYAPREIAGELYVDGGMSNQLSIETAKAMGADIIIAIDTTVEPQPISKGANVAAVSQQLLQLSVYRNWQNSISLMGSDDLLVRADISGLSVTSFERADEGIAAGRAAMTAKLAELARIKATAAPDRRKPIDRGFKRDPSKPFLVDNETFVDDALIVQRFTAGDEGRPLDERLRDLASFGGFGEIDLVQSENGLVLDVDQSGLGRTFLQAGLTASNSFNGDSTFSILGSVTRRPVSKYGGEFKIQAEVGSDIGLTAKLYQPFGPDARFFVQPELYYRGEEVLFDIGDLRVADIWQQSFGTRVRVGRELGNWGIIGLDSDLRIGRLDSQISLIEGFNAFDYTQGGFGGFVGIDVLNDLVWPTNGARVEAEAKRLLDLNDADAETDFIRLSGTLANTLGDVGIIINGRFESVDNEANDPVEILRLGGFRRLSAYPNLSIPTDEYSYGSFEVFRRITAEDATIGLPVYIGAVFEVAEANFNFLEIGAEESFSSAGLYLGAQTPVGPLFLGGALGEDSVSAIFLQLGRRF